MFTVSTYAKQWWPITSDCSWENRVKSSWVNSGSLTPLSMMIVVTDESRALNSSMEVTVALGFFMRLGWSARAPTSIHHFGRISLTRNVNVHVCNERIRKSHIGEIGHVYTSLQANMNHSREWCDEDNGMKRCHQWWESGAWSSLFHQSTPKSSLCIISVVLLSFSNMRAPWFIWMDSSSGKSSQSLTSQSLTLKHSTSTARKRKTTKLEWFESRHV